MSDKHTLSIDYQIAQARLVKKLKAENSQLRQRIIDLEKQLNPVSSQPTQQEISYEDHGIRQHPPVQ
jgi:cell division protein FtsB